MPDEPASRLITIGLPPRAPGWVPEQPPIVRPPSVEVHIDPPAVVSSPPSRIDELRLAIADRLPPTIGAKLEQASTRAIVVVLAALIAVAVVGVKLYGHHSTSYSDYGASSYNDGATPSAVANPGADGSSIVVDVGGQVRHPGLVTLPLGARVADAIRAAGGPLHRRELARIDLAARVTDGQLLIVGGSSSGTASPQSPAPVSLSTATLEELETLPGVGPVTAQKIIDWRTAHGGFTSVSQLQQVSGIGPARYAQLSPLVTP